MTPWLLVPAKSQGEGKSRLRQALPDALRQALNVLLLRNMLTAATRFPGAGRTAVISACEEILELAAASNVHAIRQTWGPGLDAAVTQGVDALRRLGAGAVVVAASDLPMIGAADLFEVTEVGKHAGGLVIYTDKNRSGTNALYLPQDEMIRFRFGEGSRRAHAGEALRNGMSVTVRCQTRVAFDIDTPEDLQQWMGFAGPGVSPADVAMPRSLDPRAPPGSQGPGRLFREAMRSASSCYRDLAS